MGPVDAPLLTRQPGGELVHQGCALAQDAVGDLLEVVPVSGSMGSWG